MGAVGTTTPPSAVPKRRRSFNDLPSGGGSALKNPDLSGAWGADSADGLLCASDLAVAEAGDCGVFLKSKMTMPVEVPSSILSFFSAMDGDGSSADAVD